MTAMILINATLGVAVLTAIVSVVAWAIKTQDRDFVTVATSSRARRSPARRRGFELAHQAG